MIRRLINWFKVQRLKNTVVKNKAYANVDKAPAPIANPDPITLVIPGLTAYEAVHIKDYAETYLKRIDQLNAMRNKNRVDSTQKVSNNVLNLTDEKTKLEIAKLRDPKKRI